MLILSLDTTTKAGSVAVLRDDDVLSVEAGEPSRTHGERLPGEIEVALAAAGVRATELDLLVVASGPGAFTGLRIGLAAIQGLAMVLAKPVIGVSALDALAHELLTAPSFLSATSIESARVAGTWMDAQRGEVYAALYEAAVERSELPWRERQPPIVGRPEEIVRAWQRLGVGPVRLIGDGALRFRAVLEGAGQGWMVEKAVPLLAPALARIGRRRAVRGEAGPPHMLQPLYVRRPDAEIERQRRAQP